MDKGHIVLAGLKISVNIQVRESLVHDNDDIRALLRGLCHRCRILLRLHTLRQLLSRRYGITSRLFHIHKLQIGDKSGNEAIVPVENIRSEKRRVKPCQLSHLVGFHRLHIAKDQTDGDNHRY